MTDLERLREAVRNVLADTPVTNDDKLDRRMRWSLVAAHAMDAGPGDVVEIGALAGESTVLFCEWAESKGRKVLVVDPWLAPTINVAGWEYDAFMKRTERWRNSGVLDVCKSKSQKDSTVQRLRCGQWAFALVDGSHLYGDVLADILNVEHARVICCDDMNTKGVRRAFDESLAGMPGRVGIHDETLGRKWEGYIV